MTERPDDWAADASAPQGDHEDAAPPPTDPPADAATLIDGPAAVDATEVRAGGIGARVVAIAVGAVLLVGGVAFAATQVGGDSGGGSPEEAVSQLFDALAEEDVLGVLATLDEGERDTLSQPLQDLFAELERLEVLDESMELSGVPGVDLEFEGLAFRSEPIIDGVLARVYLTGGTASYTVDGAELPVGDFLTDTLERFGVDPATFSGSDQDDVRGDDATASDEFLVAHDTGDGWRISIGYTAVEAARIDQGAPVPATGLAPIGADSPEAAVEGLLQAAVDLDLRGVVARLSPDELGALHHYWPVLVDESSIPTAEELGVSIELADLELDSDVDGDHAQVFIRSIGADVVAEDVAGGATIADGCISLRGDALEVAQEELGIEDDTVCQDELPEILEEAMGDVTGLGITGLGAVAVPGDEVPDLGITTTQVDGKWYVAPIRTWADVGIEVLRTVERSDLDAAIDAVEGFFGSGFFTGGMVGGGFVPPGMSDDLGGFEEFEDVVTEEFGAVGEPLTRDDGTGTMSFETGAVDPAVRASVEQLVGLATDDPDAAACLLGELDATLAPEQWVELAASYDDDVDPSVATQEAFFAAVNACGG